MDTTTANDNNELPTLNIGRSMESAVWRTHRYMSSIRVTRIEFAGKRGKRCEEFAVTSYDDDALTAASDPIVALTLSCASVEAIRAAVFEVAAKVGGQAYAETLRGIDVPLAGVGQSNGLMSITCDGVRACLCDLVDSANEPRIIYAGKRARKIYDFLRENAAAVAAMSFSQVDHALEAIGVHGHYYCAMD
jgi:hypothetical protein